jgi:hypothetical protein
MPDYIDNLDEIYELEKNILNKKLKKNNLLSSMINFMNIDNSSILETIPDSYFRTNFEDFILKNTPGLEIELNCLSNIDNFYNLVQDIQTNNCNVSQDFNPNGNIEVSKSNSDETLYLKPSTNKLEDAATALKDVKVQNIIKRYLQNGSKLTINVIYNTKESAIRYSEEVNYLYVSSIENNDFINDLNNELNNLEVTLHISRTNTNMEIYCS